MKRILILFLIMIMVTACSTAVKDDKLTIITSVYPAYDFTKKVVGGNANVELIVPNGSDAHSFEPTPKDIAKIQDADIFVFHGAGLESWVDSVLGSLSSTNVTLINLSESATLIENEQHDEHDHDHDDHDHGIYDVHTWLSIDNAIKQIDTIYNNVIAKDSDHLNDYKANYDKTIDSLRQLKVNYEKLSSLGGHKDILVDHKAYGYLAHEYDLHQLSIIQGTLSEEPTAKELEVSIQFIKEHGVEAIFVNPNSSNKVYDIIKSETGVHVLPLHTLESLTKAEMDEGLDYITLMQRNLESLLEGLNHEGSNH